MTSNRSPLAQIVMMDGSFASLAEGRGSSLARIHALLRGGMGPLPGQVELHYAPGQQWAAWRTLPELVAGASLERNIRRAYGWLARRWQPGVALYFFGYSRGAVGVCALAQMIARVGLLRRQQVSAERLRCAWNIFRYAPEHRLDPQLCHDHVPIRMIGLLDMVMSLGLRLPMVWDLAAPDFDYGRGQLAPNVEYGAHALALDETRSAFQPILWEGGEHPGRVNQVWFRGCHADIGGQLGQHEFARPLANLPLVWLLSQAQERGLPLPTDWHGHLPCDANAPALGSWRSWGKAFLIRGPRQAGQDGSHRLHPTVREPYAGPARLTGELASFAAPRRTRLLGLRRDGGMDSSAPA
jgi:hypothetical protein